MFQQILWFLNVIVSHTYELIFPHVPIEVSQKIEKYKYCKVFNEKSDQLKTIKFFKIWSDYCAENDSFSEKSTLQWYFGFRWNTTVNHGLSSHG